MTIRVAIVDDQMLIRQGIRALLELVPELVVAAEASDGVEALDMLGRVPVDVVLVDVRMPRLDGRGNAGTRRTRQGPCYSQSKTGARRNRRPRLC